MQSNIDIEFNECPTCGSTLIGDEECVVCEEEERRARPRKPASLKKMDPKRTKKEHNRRKHGYEH